MADYILYPTSYKGLGGEMQRLVDDYQAKRASEEDLLRTLTAWRKNCDFMLQDGELAPSIVKYIGKRRSMVVTKALDL